MNADSPTRSILIVDDDLALLDAMQRAFSEAGKTVVAKGSFEEARYALRHEHFDVLITDVRLGAFNGLQLAVLARDLRPDIKLIVFSGFDDPVLKAEAERIGAAYLVKPVSSAVLLQMVDQPA